MRLQSLEASGYEKFRKKTRKKLFPEVIDEIIPWKETFEAIEPYNTKPKGAGKKPIGLELMLRIHSLQHWWPSDPGAEEALYDSQVIEDLLHGNETRG